MRPAAAVSLGLHLHLHGHPAGPRGARAALVPRADLRWGGGKEGSRRREQKERAGLEQSAAPGDGEGEGSDADAAPAPAAGYKMVWLAAGEGA